MIFSTAARRAPALAPSTGSSLLGGRLPLASAAMTRRGLAAWDSDDWDDGTAGGRRGGRSVATTRQKQRRLPSMRRLVTSPFDRLVEAFENDLSDMLPTDRDLMPLVGGAGQWGSELAEWAPRVNVSEDDKAIHVHAELPGVKKDDVRVEIDDDGRLVIKGEKKMEKKEEDKDRRYTRVESSFGRFERRIPLPEGVSRDQIKAKCTEGVLEVDIPRPAPREQPATTAIPIE
jgi:HSP20 family protein